MPTVVTGAAGFIGRHVVAALLADGHRVVGIDRHPYLPEPGETALTADLVAADDTVLTALREAEAVVHLAGRPGVRDRGPDADLARWHDNVLAGTVVLDHTPDQTPLLVASSSSVYGGAHLADGVALPCREDQPLAPRGSYAATKAELERRCSARAARGAHVAVFRPFTVAGEGQRPDMALSIWLAQARSGAPMTILGSPTRRRDVTDVRAVAHGIRRLLETGHRMTVNLGTGATFTLHELTAAVATVLDVPHRTVTVGADPVEVPATRADTSRCAAMLGFTPTTDLLDLVGRQARTATPSLEVS